MQKKLKMKKSNTIIDKPLVNRVANSGIITINLEDHYPTLEIVEFDLKDYLFRELMLKEKDFRTALKELDWSVYADKIVLVYCSTDAILPVWSFMLVSAYLKPVTQHIYQGTRTEYLKFHYEKVIDSYDVSELADKRVVIKGCSDKEVPPSAYASITAKLQPLTKSIMYGEPCSTVPIYKKPRKA